MSRSAKVLEKAARLVADGAVIRAGRSETFYVKGSTGTYAVTFSEPPPRYTGGVPGRRTCTCTWGRSGNEGPCSHILAVSAILRAEAAPADPFEGIV